MRIYFPVDGENGYHPAPPMTRGDGVIEIRYGAVRSPVSGRADAWAPVVEVNGRRSVPWRALDRNAAMDEAREMATDERLRFTGDWTITVRKMT